MRTIAYMFAVCIATMLMMGDLAGITVEFRSPVVITIPNPVPPDCAAPEPAPTPKPRKAPPKPPVAAPDAKPPLAADC
jgi:hypothetical protein